MSASTVSARTWNAVLHPGGQRDGRAAGEDHLRLVGDEARGGDDDLIAGIEHRRQRQIERLRDADGDQHFAAGVVFNAVTQTQVVGDGAAQLDRPRVGGVVRVAVLDGAQAGLQDRRRGDEVGFADARAR